MSFIAWRESQFHNVTLKVIHQKKERKNTSIHDHEFMELVVVSGGSALHNLCGEARTVAAGDVFVISPHQWHGYTECRHFDYYDILFDPVHLGLQQADIAALKGYHALFSIEPYLRQRNSLPGGLKINREQLDSTIILLEQIVHELDSELPGKLFSATAYFMQLVIQLCRYYESVWASAYVAGHNNATGLLALADVLSYIEQNLKDRISVNELAGRAMLSRSSFIRSFESIVGKAPLEYINSRRLQKACHLLQHTVIPIGEIAFESGFGDSNYFARYFKKQTGLSPRQYRNQHNGS